MVENSLWVKLRDADAYTRSLIGKPLQSLQLDEDLRIALSSTTDDRLAFRILRDADVGLIERLFDDVFEAAIESQSNVVIAREVISRLGADFLAERLGDLIAAKLASQSVTEFEYRQIAGLVSYLGQDSMLLTVLTRAADSSDPDIRDVLGDRYSIRLTGAMILQNERS